MANTQILQSLTQDTFDTLTAYRRALSIAHTGALRQVLETRICERGRTLGALNEQLARTDETRIDDPSAAAQAAELFRSLADALQDGDEAAVNRIEKAETDLCQRFDEALGREDLDSSTRRTIESAAREVREGESVSHVLERQYG